MTLLDHLPALRSPDSLLGRPDLSGLRTLLGELQRQDGRAVAVSDHLDLPAEAGSVPVLVIDAPLEPAIAATVAHHLADHLARGDRAVVLVSAGGADTLAHLAPVVASSTSLAVPSPHDPLVLDRRVVARGVGPLEGTRVEADDLVALRPAGATPTQVLATVDHAPVALAVEAGPGTLVVIGSTAVATNRWIAAAGNATALGWAITGALDSALVPIVGDHLPRAGSPRAHAQVEVIDNEGDEALAALLPADEVAVGAPGFLRAAGRAGRLLSPAVHDALSDFADAGAPAGAILLRGMPIGTIPATPVSPVAPVDKDHLSELTLLTVARRLGQPIGYEPEHGGDIVQNLLPTEGDIGRQTSTSSGVELEFHTETAFHPHKPRFLLLLCLRGDPSAETLLCSIGQVVGRLPLGVQQVLREPRFRTGIDESFTGTRSDRLGNAMPVLGGTEAAPTFTFDADLMTGLDAEATEALETLRSVIRDEHIAVALEAGDLLVVDNSLSVHGRSPFTARFDGTDRWLQRTFVVTDLAASATDRRGRVITTRFA